MDDFDRGQVARSGEVFSAVVDHGCQKIEHLDAKNQRHRERWHELEPNDQKNVDRQPDDAQDILHPDEEDFKDLLILGQLVKFEPNIVQTEEYNGLVRLGMLQ